MLQGRKQFILITALLCAAFSSVADDLSVLLPNQSVRLDYPQPTRLEMVLKDVQAQAKNSQQAFEPIQAQLFDVEKQTSINQKKQQVLNQLAAFHQQEPDLATESLIRQINSATFHYREFTSLDYDVVQSQRGANPLLAGHYQLNIAPRKSEVYFLGALKKPVTAPQKAQWFLADYFKALGNVRLDESDDSTAFIIQPDGKVIVAKYGSWNFEPHFIAPGAIVYVPFQSLPTEYETLNQDIAQLLRHKVMNNEQ